MMLARFGLFMARPLGQYIGLGVLIGWALTAAALFATRARLEAVRMAHENEAQARKIAAIEQDNFWLGRLADAQADAAGRNDLIAAIAARSNERTILYAQTDAGRARCLDPDRVRGIEADDRDLQSAATAASPSDGAVPNPAAGDSR